METGAHGGLIPSWGEAGVLMDGVCHVRHPFAIGAYSEGAKMTEARRMVRGGIARGHRVWYHGDARMNAQMNGKPGEHNRRNGHGPDRD